MGTIKERRKEAGLSQSRLGKLVGASEATVSRLESGRIRLSYDWMLRIAKVLGCRPIDLLGPEFFEGDALAPGLGRTGNLGGRIRVDYLTDQMVKDTAIAIFTRLKEEKLLAPDAKSPDELAEAFIELLATFTAEDARRGDRIKKSLGAVGVRKQTPGGSTGGGYGGASRGRGRTR